MKDRFTINFFVVVACFFVLAVAGCKQVAGVEDEDDSTNDVELTTFSAQKSEAVKDADKLVDKLVDATVEEKSPRPSQEEMKVAKYLKKYSAGQRLFVLNPDLASCNRWKGYVDCSDKLEKLLAAMSRACEIVDVDMINGGAFVDFTGGFYQGRDYSYKTGVTITTALLVRVSTCTLPDKR